MIDRVFEIQVNSSDANKDLGFEILENSGTSVICLEDEKYVVSENAIKMLNERSVKFEVISINGELTNSD